MKQNLSRLGTNIFYRQNEPRQCCLGMDTWETWLHHSANTRELLGVENFPEKKIDKLIVREEGGGFSVNCLGSCVALLSCLHWLQIGELSHFQPSCYRDHYICVSINRHTKSDGNSSKSFCVLMARVQNFDDLPRGPQTLQLSGSPQFCSELLLPL